MNLKENIQRIISVRRNLIKFPDFVRSTYRWLNCSAFKNFDDYLNRVIFSSIRDFIGEVRPCREMDLDDDECFEVIKKVGEILKGIIMNEYYDEIFKYYQKEMGYKINIDENLKKIVSEKSDKTDLLQKYVKKVGLKKTAQLIGTTQTWIAKKLDIFITPKIANDLLIENIENNELLRYYEEFEIFVDMNGIVNWNGTFMTGGFKSNYEETIEVMATPFWDNHTITPIDVSYYGIHTIKGEPVYDTSPAGDFFDHLDPVDGFSNVDELFKWYKNVYLPDVYYKIMNVLLPQVQAYVSHKLTGISETKLINKSKPVIVEDKLTFLRRRLPEVGRLVDYALNTSYRPDKICGKYENSTVLFNVVGHWIIEQIYHLYFWELDDTSKEWDELAETILKYIKNNYEGRIKETFTEDC